MKPHAGPSFSRPFPPPSHCLNNSWESIILKKNNSNFRSINPHHPHFYSKTCTVYQPLTRSWGCRNYGDSACCLEWAILSETCVGGKACKRSLILPTSAVPSRSLLPTWPSTSQGQRFYVFCLPLYNQYPPECLEETLLNEWMETNDNTAWSVNWCTCKISSTEGALNPFGGRSAVERMKRLDGGGDVWVWMPVGSNTDIPCMVFNS